MWISSDRNPGAANREFQLVWLLTCEVSSPERAVQKRGRASSGAVQPVAAEDGFGEFERFVARRFGVGELVFHAERFPFEFAELMEG